MTLIDPCTRPSRPLSHDNDQTANGELIFDCRDMFGFTLQKLNEAELELDTAAEQFSAEQFESRQLRRFIRRIRLGAKFADSDEKQKEQDTDPNLVRMLGDTLEISRAAGGGDHHGLELGIAGVASTPSIMHGVSGRNLSPNAGVIMDRTAATISSLRSGLNGLQGANDSERMRILTIMRDEIKAGAGNNQAQRPAVPPPPVQLPRRLASRARWRGTWYPEMSIAIANTAAGGFATLNKSIWDPPRDSATDAHLRRCTRFDEQTADRSRYLVEKIRADELNPNMYVRDAYDLMRGFLSDISEHGDLRAITTCIRGAANGSFTAVLDEPVLYAAMPEGCRAVFSALTEGMGGLIRILFARGYEGQRASLEPGTTTLDWSGGMSQVCGRRHKAFYPVFVGQPLLVKIESEIATGRGNLPLMVAATFKLLNGQPAIPMISCDQPGCAGEWTAAQLRGATWRADDHGIRIPGWNRPQRNGDGRHAVESREQDAVHAWPRPLIITSGLGRAARASTRRGELNIPRNWAHASMTELMRQG